MFYHESKWLRDAVLKAQTVGSKEMTPQVAMAVAKVLSEADKMADALLFYGNEENYKEQAIGKVGMSYAAVTPPVVWDKGQMAQNAIGTWKTAKQIETMKDNYFDPEMLL